MTGSDSLRWSRTNLGRVKSLRKQPLQCVYVSVPENFVFGSISAAVLHVFSDDAPLYCFLKVVSSDSPERNWSCICLFS